MKKYFMMAFMAATAFAFTACSNSDSDDGNNSNGGGGATSLKKISSESALLLTNIKATDSSKPGVNKIPLELELNADNTFVWHNKDINNGEYVDLSLKGGSSKARKGMAMDSKNPWDFEWIIGEYTVEGNNYTIPGLAVITVAGNGTNLTFKFSETESPGASATPETTDKYPSSDSYGWTCRKWKVTQTRIELNGKSQFTGQWDNCNFKTICTELQKSIDYDINKVKDLTDLGELQYVRFTLSGRTVFYFTKSIYYGKWNFKPSDNTFHWDLDGTSGNDLINGTGDGSIKFSGNTAAITLKAEFNDKTYSGDVMFKLEAAQ